MCGIFALLNNTNIPKSFVTQAFEKGKHRGPEHTIYKNVMIHADFGFHRLAINGLNDESNQPIIIEDVALICNGEIYNYKELYGDMNVMPTTDSDCEVIIHMYMKYGIEHTLQMLDGVFAFILIDYRLHNKDAKMFVARDPYGVRPLYVLRNVNDDYVKTVQNTDAMHPYDKNMYVFASELKELTDLKNAMNSNIFAPSQHKYDIEQFTPGTYSILELE